MIPPFDVAESLAALPRVRHGFFGRAGGVSTGLFESLNCGLGSADEKANALENRARAARALGVEPSRLATLHQTHSAIALVVEKPFLGDRPQADGMATRTPGLALGVLAADCMPLLFADADAQVVGAAHAGWRGALGGVIEATIAAMVSLGAASSRIVAALGPCLRPPHFQVGPDLVEAFLARHPDSARFFSPDAAPGIAPDRRQFDLAGFAAARLAALGVSQFEDIGASTLAEPDRWFSYRASRRSNAPDYGRNLSAIALEV